MRNLKVMLLTSVFVLGLVFSAHAIPLFQEDWDSGSINTAVWEVNVGNGTNASASVELDLIGTDDYAIYTRGGGDWTTWFASTATFPRGNNLRITFTCWPDPSKSQPTEWAGVQQAVYGAVNGPWKDPVSYTAGAHAYPVASVLQPGNGVHYFSQTHNDWSGPGPYGPMDDFKAAFEAATDKSNAPIVRVWLGDTMGAKCEWSDDQGTTWYEIADDRLTGTTYTQDPARIAFGTYGCAVFIDDIIVENDLFTEGPFVEDWDSGTIDTSLWEVNVGNGTNASASVELDLIDTGDYAIFTRGGGDWTTWFASQVTFNRGNNIRCTFNAWPDPSKSLPTEWAGVQQAVYGAVNGPWKDPVSYTAGAHAYPVASVLQPGNGVHYFSQTHSDWSGPGPYGAMDDFKAAFEAATDKASSPKIRIWLGDEYGAKCEWSDDQGTTWYEIADDRLTGVTYAQNPARLAFGTYGCAVFIDDIIVEDDLNEVLSIEGWMQY